MKATNLYLTLGTEVIYEDASFQFNNLDKVGIVGVNGAGKTTLFKVLLGQLELDSGNISLGKGRVGFLPQEVKFENPNITVFDYLLQARPIEKINKRLEQIYVDLATQEDENKQKELLKEMAKLQEELESLDCYNAENILLKIIEDMQIDDNLLSSKLCELSGGQKSKVAFAGILYGNPDFLLLDEPTNHLDASTKDFITNYLKNYKGTILVISHDIDFLNKIINKVMYINKINHKIKMYDGNYTKFKKKLLEEKQLKESRIEQQEKEIKKLEEFIFKANQASRTNHNLKRMGKDREAKLEKKKAELELRDKEYKKLNINIEPIRQGSKVPLKVEDLTFHYDKKPNLYEKLSFNLTDGEKFLIVGENGVGKSTLLKLIMGKLKPNKGSITFGTKTDIGYYAQELELLEDDKTIFDNVQNAYFNDLQLRSLLGNFLFFDQQVFKKIKILSPGEKARVSLCKLLLQKANLLILDEPTNHLDPETQAIIGENFGKFSGTILLVSHNPSFVEQIGVTRMLILPEGRIVDYSKELLEYYYLINNIE
ncbi:MAG: ABC-F family ATP-binding cassette domain-containing protein [Clostridia bacterium]|nr:ABC-F family ATP-binding cassette domain-containing protein [Clostridia bacterium]